MLTKLKASAAALVLGVVAAGAIVSAQPPGGGRAEPSDPATKSGRPESRPRQGRQPDRRLDPRRRPGRQEGDHRRPQAALHPPVVGEPEAGRPAKRRGRPRRPGARQVLQDHRRRRGLHERADRRQCRPLPRRGGALPHRRAGLLRRAPDRPGAGEVDHLPVPVAHRPQRRRLPDGVLHRCLWAGHPKRGSYTLTIEETGEQAAQERTIKAPIDGIITKNELRLFDRPRSEATK